MPSDVVAAVPVDLLTLGGRTAGPDLRMRAAAAALAPPWSGDLGAVVRDHAERARRLGALAASTGAALLLAGGAIGALAAVISLASPGGIADPLAAAATVAGALGLPVAFDGDVRRPDAAPLHVAWLAAAVGPAALAELARRHPHLVGPVDGMPVAARFAANGLLAPELAAQGRRLLFVDPVRGLAAEVVGDLAEADHLAVVVPGMGNSLRRLDVVTAKAQALVAAAARLHPPARLAAVAWLGYPSPGLPEVVLDDAASAAAPHLARLAAGLEVAAPCATRTVVGHSYGSLVAGRALGAGLDVDAVALTGSPGLGAARASDLGPTPLYVLRAPGDVVSWSERFGPDPSDPDFGATRLATGSAIGHAGYFEAGTDALENLALVAVGRAAQASVARGGWAGWVSDRLEPVHDVVIDAPADGIQRIATAGAGAASWLTDEAEARLPRPVARALDGARGAAGGVFEVGNGVVDLGQRLSSPDLYGDVIDDLVDIAEVLWR